VAHPFFICLLFCSFTKEGGKEKKKPPQILMPLLPSQPQVVFSFRQASFFATIRLFTKKREVQNKTKQILWILIWFFLEETRCLPCG
jgi:hypothetical protein